MQIEHRKFNLHDPAHVRAELQDGHEIDFLVELGGERLTVSDTGSKEMRVYFNPLGQEFQPVRELQAFGSCP